MPESETAGRWTVLPRSEWADEFSPLYANESGLLAEGDFSARDQTTPSVISRLVGDPVTGISVSVPAVQNELMIQFRPCATGAEVRALIDCMELQIVSAWFEPSPGHPDTSVSWFHLRIPSHSPYFNDVKGAIDCAASCPSVLHASYNDVMELCQGLYPPNGEPGDPLLADTIYDAYEFAELSGAKAAWHPGNKVEFFGPANSTVCVVVMDTGVDVDHEDFLRVQLYDQLEGTPLPGANFEAARNNSVTQMYTEGGARRGIAHVGGQTCHGDVPQWEPFNGPWRAKSTASPPSSARHPLKRLEFEHTGHGHGTLMAGIIAAAGGNGTGTVGFGTANVRIMSARMRLCGPTNVDIASAVRLVKCLRRHFGRREDGTASAVRVVYMGFALDLAKRATDPKDYGDSKGMDDLLRAMRKDRSVGNDRVWIAPAHNRVTGNFEQDGGLLSYPAAILTKKAAKRSADRETLEPGTAKFNPAVLGVTGIRPASGVIEVTNSNWCVEPSGDDATRFTADRTVYGVSAPDNTRRPVIDARDYYYRQAGQAGYTGFGGATRDDAYDRAVRQSGGYAEGDVNPATGVSSRTQRLPIGNSIAAAQIAALAGILMSKWSDWLPVGLAAGATDLSGESEADRVVWGIQQSSAVDVSRTVPGLAPRPRRVVPGGVNFRSALERDLAVRPGKSRRSG